MTAVFKWITPDAENMIVNIARVSNPENRDNMATAKKLLVYLIKHEHVSPFQMGNLCVELQGISRAISAQILRHASFSFQELSQRYVKVGPPPSPPQRTQDAKNRQSSHDNIETEKKAKYDKKLEENLAGTYALYEEMLDEGFSKETARMILPMCTETTLIINGNIRSWMFYLKLRTKEDTQFEHRQIALQCLAIFKEHLPTIYEAFFTE
jgi:thymidylate synthase (FAD)